VLDLVMPLAARAVIGGVDAVASDHGRDTDLLTGLLNRRELERRLPRVEANDVVVHVHLEGLAELERDRGRNSATLALRTLAACLADSCRRGDWCGRLGGADVQRIRDRWRKLDPVTTIAAGVAVHDGGDAAVTLRRSEQAVERARASGPGQVAFHPDDATAQGQ
jgi:hypothetical protein